MHRTGGGTSVVEFAEALANREEGVVALHVLLVDITFLASVLSFGL